MLAFRRQRYQAIATAPSDYDAGERRITDLYTKAADQLGSDIAPVRLAGLYALERLAQDAPRSPADHRQPDLRLPPPGADLDLPNYRHRYHQQRYQAARRGTPAPNGWGLWGRLPGVLPLA
jgi:hypothetical protein